jgi:peptidoglycan/xylan/chitin deacetylase (PgdA/CDA1 family)
MPDRAPTICLTFDFDAISAWAGTLGLTSPSAVSRGEFSARVAVPRVLDVLARAGARATFFVPGITIETWPDLCRRILDEGHEIGHHGYHHISPATMEEAAEREQLERGLEAMDRCLGGHRAVGYRSPGAELSPSSTLLLAEYGFTYESSMSAQDFEPYRCRAGDVIELTGAARFGPEIELVEIPFSWSLDDFPQMEFVLTPNLVLEGLNDPEKCERMWLADLDYMVEEVPGGVFCMCFHPEVIGRGARIRVLERMIARGSAHGARFTTARDAAADWTRRNPFRAPVATPPAGR